MPLFSIRHDAERKQASIVFQFQSIWMFVRLMMAIDADGGTISNGLTLVLTDILHVSALLPLLP